MCGIFYIYDESHSNQTNQTKTNESAIHNAINTIKHRGPDTSQVISNKYVTMGFHRLIINGSNGLSNQPMTLDGQTYLLCNGEIYNHMQLQQKYNVVCTTGSDCEIILHLYNILGFTKMVQELDGEFAIIIVTENKVYIARDPYGVRSLYIAVDIPTNKICIASESKAIYKLFSSELIKQFKPGNIGRWSIMNPNNNHLIVGENPEKYLQLPYHNYKRKTIKMSMSMPVNDDDNNNNNNNNQIQTDIIYNIRKLLITAVEKRTMCSRMNTNSFGVYLSGGLDSSIIAAVLQKKMAPLKIKIKTFSIGFENSPDLYYARQVAEHIGSIHSECIITEEIAIGAINSVIYATETYDVTTVRASIMMYLLSKHINETSSVVVVFSGEGSDEASGSYRYFHNAPSSLEFNSECERLLSDLHLFDNLRVDKSSAAFGLEARIPFLDLDFINYYMTIPRELKTQRGIEKFLFRKAFVDMLPESIITRPKEAMSDGVSHVTRSWSDILQGEAIRVTGISDPIYAERELYWSIFNKHYNGCGHQIPYYWLPRWCGDIKDPSARTLPFYNGSV